ncbi:MAG: hypothetical protein ACUVQ0_01455 [Thermoproteota archaeon]
MKNIMVRPVKYPNLSLIIMVRRMQFSLDRKFEMVGVLEILKDRLKAYDHSQLLNRMIAEAVEIELKGVLKKKVEIRRWSELANLAQIIEIPEGGSLMHVLEEDEVRNQVEKGGAELIEVFPKLIQTEFLEYYFMSPGKNPMLNRLIKEYVKSPQALSWIVRMHMLYGMPGKSRLGKSYSTFIGLSKKIEDFTYSKLLP